MRTGILEIRKENIALAKSFEDVEFFLKNAGRSDQ